MKTYIPFLFLCYTITSHAQVVNQISTGQNFRQYVQSLSNDATTFSANNNLLTTFNAKEDTEGSPYLFKNWVRGKVYMKNLVFDEPENVLNYDKISKRLVMKISNQKILNINMDDIQSFTLIDSSQTVAFTHLTQQPWNYFVQIYKGTLYSLYKIISTKFYKANYINKGLYESGFKYDRYVDEITWYINQADAKTYEIRNTTKDLKKLRKQLPVVDDFFKKTEAYADDETLLTALVVHMNKE